MSLDHIRNSLVGSGLLCEQWDLERHTQEPGEPNKPLIRALVYQCCVINQLSGALVFAQTFEVRRFSLNDFTGITSMTCIK